MVFLEKLRCLNTFNASLNNNFVRADGNTAGYQTYLFYAGGVIYTAYIYIYIYNPHEGDKLQGNSATNRITYFT